MWKFISLIHNLPLEEAVGNNYIAVVPFNDKRLDEQLRASPEFQKFVTSFTDQFGREQQPSLLIVRTKAAQVGPAIMAFRNALAISSITRAWASFLAHEAQLEYFKYSNYFDLYPYRPSKDPQILGVNSPSLFGIDEVSEFRGQTSPALAPAHTANRFYDEVLFSALLEKWVEHFIKRTGDNWRSTALFRSLEMAYIAAEMPFQNMASIGDYGARLALWVSASEILARPQDAKVDLKTVLALLEKSHFHSRRLKAKRYSCQIEKKRHTLRLVGKLYYEMHRARNAFLHGNPISLKVLFPGQKTQRYGLNSFAPVVYKCALYSFLDIWGQGIDLSKISMPHFINVRNMEDALVSSTTNKPRSKAGVTQRRYR